MPIINDTLDDGNRTVLLALSNPIGGAVLGANSSATLTIANNDILNVRGLYAVGNTPGVSTVTLKSCSAPVNDGTFQVTGSLNITTQSGRTFSGNGTLDYFNPGLGPTVRLRVPLKATVGSGGAISGTYNFNVTQPPATTIVSSGNGSFTASLAMDTLTAAIIGQLLTGESCQITGTLVGTR